MKRPLEIPKREDETLRLADEASRKSQDAPHPLIPSPPPGRPLHVAPRLGFLHRLALVVLLAAATDS